MIDILFLIKGSSLLFIICYSWALRLCTEVLDIKKTLWGTKIWFWIFYSLSEPALSLYTFGLNLNPRHMPAITNDSAIYFVEIGKLSPFEKPKCTTWFTDMFQSFLLYSFFPLCFWNRLNLQSLWLPLGAWRQRSEHTAAHAWVHLHGCQYVYAVVKSVLPSRTTCYCSCKCDLIDFFPSIFPDILKVSETMEKRKEKNFQWRNIIVFSKPHVTFQMSVLYDIVLKE